MKFGTRIIFCKSRWLKLYLVFIFLQDCFKLYFKFGCNLVWNEMADVYFVTLNPLKDSESLHILHILTNLGTYFYNAIAITFKSY